MLDSAIKCGNLRNMNDTNEQAWCIGYGAFWDGYDLGCMSSTYNASQNKQFIYGWLAAQNEDNQK